MWKAVVNMFCTPFRRRGSSPCSECRSGMRGRKCRGVWGHPRPPVRRGREQKPPAASARQHHELVGHSLFAGRSVRSPAPGAVPSQASPAAKVTACCSAMPTSKYRSGKRSANRIMPSLTHGRSDANQPVVGFGHIAQPFAKHLSVTWFAARLAVFDAGLRG